MTSIKETHFFGGFNSFLKFSVFTKRDFLTVCILTCLFKCVHSVHILFFSLMFKIKPLCMPSMLKFITSAYTSPVQKDLQPPGRARKLFKDESFS